MKPFYLSLFFVFGVFFSVDSQTGLTTFTNYGSCYQGLKDEKGEILWPADFESLVKIWDYDYTAVPRNVFWVAEKNGSFGLIDPKGKVVLPFNHTRIASYTDGFIAADEHSTRLISRQLETIWELPEYSWTRPFPTGYIVEKEDKIGFLDLNHNEVLPTSYDRIDFCYIQYQGEARQELLSNRFLTVELDGKEGIFDLIQNKWVIEFTTENIRPKWVMDYTLENINQDWAILCSGSDAVFQLNESGSNDTRIVNSSGREILTSIDKNTVRFHLTPIDSCGTQSYQMAHIVEDNKMKALNLKTGQVSTKYMGIYPIGGYTIYFEEKKWGVLDSNFKELGRFSYPRGIAENSNFRPGNPARSSEWRYEELFSEYHNYKSDSVLIFLEYLNEKQRRKSTTELYEIFGLVNFHTGKKIKSFYHWITEVQFEGSTYYWAIKYKYHEEGMELLERFDIFDSDLKLLRGFKEGVVFGNYDRRKKIWHRVIYEDGKSGVIDPRGHEIIPLVYSNCYPLEVRVSETKKEAKTIFIAELENENTVFDYNGNVLISRKYTSFKVDRSLLHAQREDHLTDLYNYEGKLILEGAKYFRQGYYTDSLGICIGMENWPQVAPAYATFITKVDDLYMYLNDTLHLLDQNFFKFTQNYCYFHEWALIDQKGKIVTMHPKGVSKRSIREQQISPNNCSTYLDVYPVPDKKTVTKATQTYVPSPKKFIWKQHDINKPSEWFLYNGNGLLLYPESFEYPLKERVFSGGTFKQNGKYGYFDAQYNIQLEAKYDYIYPYYPLTLKDGLWKIHDLKSGKVSEGYEQISLNKLNNLRCVFHEGKIGLLNDSLELEIPLMDSVQFMKTYDLTSLSNKNGYPKYKQIHEVRGLIFNGSPKEVYRKINNRHIIEEQFLYSTANDLLQFSPVDHFREDLHYGIRYLKIHHNPTATRRDRRPSFFNQYYYSEMTLTRLESWSDNQWDINKKDDRFKFREFFNYKIVGNDFVPIQLKEVLKTDANSTSKLNELMIRELTKIQAFGDNCTDIEDKLVQLKKNFLLRKSSITFFWSGIGGFEINLSFEELKSIFIDSKKVL